MASNEKYNVFRVTFPLWSYCVSSGHLLLPRTDGRHWEGKERKFLKDFFKKSNGLFKRRKLCGWSGLVLWVPAVRSKTLLGPANVHVWPAITPHNSQIPAIEDRANRVCCCFFLALVSFWMLSALNIRVTLTLLVICYVCCAYIMLSWLLTTLDSVVKQIVALTPSYIFSIKSEYSLLFLSRNLFPGERWHTGPLCSIMWRSVIPSIPSVHLDPCYFPYWLNHMYWWCPR